MRRPSPAFVLASIALFVSLSGVGAATVVLTGKAAQVYTRLDGRMSSNGKVTESTAGVTATHPSTGAYELTGDTDPYKDGESLSVLVTPVQPPGSNASTCQVTSAAATAAGAAKVGIACFAVSSKTGRMASADVAFSFDIAGAPAAAK